MFPGISRHRRSNRQKKVESVYSRKHSNLFQVKISKQVKVVKSSKCLSVALLNARSVNNKTLVINDFILENKLDLVALTETWLTDGALNTPVIGELVPPGYSVINVPRKSGIGGGVAVIYKSDIAVSQCDAPCYQSFEYMMLDFNILTNRIRLVVIYSPEAKTHKIGASDAFLSEFSQLIDSVCTDSGKLLVVGDFNYHAEDLCNTATRSFLSFLDSSGLKQHVSLSTHEKNHTLDLVLTRNEELEISSPKTDETVPSDHKAVLFCLNLERPPRLRTNISFRRWKNLNSCNFRKDILESSMYMYSPVCDLSDVTSSVALYNEELRGILDRNVPMKTSVVTIKS